jgi:plastocyanin
MSLFGTTVMAQESYSFVFTDEKGVPLEDVVVESVANSSGITNSQVAVIDQVDKRFKPTQIVITKGQSVEFPNSDNIRHHVYSFSKAKTFELKLYADTPEKPINFPEHGVVVLGCNIHDTMIGFIYVAKSPDTVTSNQKGTAVLISSEAVNEVNIWHRAQVSGPENLRTLSLNDLQKNSSGSYVIEIATLPPEPTNSFEDTFGGYSAAN